MGLHSEAEIDRKFIAFAKLMNTQGKARLNLLFQYLAMHVKPTP
jgi:hypothetical protein